MVDLKKYVLITGGAQGMGASHAMKLAELGWHVLIADLKEPGDLAKELIDSGKSASFYSLDVTDPQAWQTLAEELKDKFGGIDALVNNAGMSLREGISSTTDEQWNKLLAVNLTGPFYGLRSMAPLLKMRGGGSIVNISSTAALAGYHAAAYSAAKWGLRGLTKTAAMEYAPWGIRVNSVHPGLTATPMVQGADAFIASSINSIPSGRAAQPHEISAAVAFLVSDDSKYMTGSEVTVDGGLTAAGTYWRINNEARQNSIGGDL